MIRRIATLLKLDTLLARYLRLDCERSIWVEEEELGTYRTIEHRRKKYRVKIPERINKRVTLRLSGIGRRLGSKTVDLLVFMFKIGEFQLRVLRDQRLTIGYFNQGVFERMQVIVPRKLGWDYSDRG